MDLLLVAAALALSAAEPTAKPAAKPDPWAAILFLEGEWAGGSSTRRTSPGKPFEIYSKFTFTRVRKP